VWYSVYYIHTLYQTRHRIMARTHQSIFVKTDRLESIEVFSPSAMADPEAGAKTLYRSPATKKCFKRTDDSAAQASTGNHSESSSAEAPVTPKAQVPKKQINRPMSLYPAAMLGTSMIALGEIGFLIASLAETTGIFASTNALSESIGSSEIYLVTWAVALCIIIWASIYWDLGEES
jgi:hypothetical protein